MTKCNNCGAEHEQSISECTVCGYPIEGTDKEKAIFIANLVKQKSDIKDSKRKVLNARILLFVFGGFMLLFPIIFPSPYLQTIDLILNISAGAIFIGCGLLTLKNPKVGLIIPLSLTIFYYALILITTPSAIFVGIIWKIATLIGLGFGYYSVYKAEKILKNNDYLANLD